ncbi:AmpG family muropeptide MFS transporter [Bermanella marisrubri]|uniref:Muropeptide MFS uptake transporter AmpG n=1 Tax=Bermanella marisrubri TaxID=207949 RepID=Q1MXS2_9GAMM|nr:MFS transporter [Bermanella marisrubri]EAT10779.1 muropeptide MFS uptake transporter AmpG [Oceanobacter sp. RED65] [Bermanella marisrubri]QIZ83486.1 AmpG family muropeptide MFS transporter [Bermanella marisrubri]
MRAMLKAIQTEHGWKESLAAVFQRQVFYMSLLGFSAGLPLLLIFSSLSLWLREAGIDKSAVTYFSWAALGYSFKFVWAPLVDCLPIPGLTRWLGLRRSWLLLSQLGIAGAITLMATSNPIIEAELFYMAMGAVLLGFSAATQDISIDAYRIEAVDADMQGLVSASYIAGYRIGMIVSGAGALYLASYFGTTKDLYNYQAWQWSYHIMSAFVLVGILATFLITEPIKRESQFEHAPKHYSGLLLAFVLCVTGFVTIFVISSDAATESKAYFTGLFGNQALSGLLVELIRLCIGLAIAVGIGKICIVMRIVNEEMFVNSYVAPIKQFFQDYGLKTAWLLLALIGLYRISDIVLGVVSNIFYQDLGYSKNEIADAVKLFGLIMTIFGGFIGGILAMRLGVMRMLFIGAALVVITNLAFIILLYTDHNLYALYSIVAADNLVAGLASAAFVAFLSSLVNIKFTAMQYAIFSSLMTLLPKALAGYSGGIVESIGYTGFFTFAASIGVPIMILVVLVSRHLGVDIEHSESDSSNQQKTQEGFAPSEK